MNHKKYDTSNVKTITLNGKKYIDMSVIEEIKTFIAKDIIFYDLTERDKLNGFIDRKIAEVTKNE